MAYLDEFLLIAAVHFLAVASPGPDFAVIVRNSVCYGRKTALYTSVGIGTGILLHVTYSLVGIGLLIASEPNLLLALKWLAAAYFAYIAYFGLTAKAPAPEQIDNENFNAEQKPPSARKAFINGFLVNGLNIKATLFFVSLFAMVISPDTPLMVKSAYGFYMAIATTVWFASLSYMLSHQRVRQNLQRKGYWLDRVMGAVLLILALEIVWSTLSNAG